MTLLYSDPIFLKHDTGRHPETSERLRAISARLDHPVWRSDARPVRFSRSQRGVGNVHAAAQIQKVDLFARYHRYLDADTVVCPDSFAVALAAAGACSASVDAVLRGTAENALCLVRPPGHHATPTRSMGFCLFNNIALAAHRARSAHGLTRLLIVDWDVHHGNGTQDIFCEDPEVMFLSIHRYGQGFYPGTGAADETGRGNGQGYTLNVPVPFGTSRKEYHDLFTRALEAAADRIKPELVLVGVGFDAHKDDPIGSLGLEVEDFVTLTRQVREVAQIHAGGRLVSCLEGGYNLEALAASVEAHLTELLA